MEGILQTTILLLGVALFVFVAYGDIKSLRIPNPLVAAVALLGITRLIVIGDPSAALYTAGASALVLTVGFLLFWQGFCGGGDAKLVTAAALLVGYDDLFAFLFFMGVFGALGSLAMLIIHRYFPLWLGPSLAVLIPKARLSVPYGVAIAAGGITTLLSQSSLSPFLG
jgi:prepilin peptidase CpaA